MKISQLGSHLVRSGAACALAVLSLVAAPARAATIEIEFTGMDLVYDGSAIYDAGSTAGGVANPADADPLTTVDFSIDGVPVGSLTSDVSLDVFIPGVTGISSAPATVYNILTPPAGGFFDLLVGTSPLASEFLLVDLDEVNVTYVDVANIVQFTFGAAVSDVFAQNLPFGLEIGDPVSVSFSAQIKPGTRTAAAGFVTGFEAAGTGEINGPQIPEPATCLLAAISLVGLATRRK
jgi:hypothetical protein